MLLEDRKEKRFSIGQVSVESAISDPCGVVGQSESAAHGGGQAGDRLLGVSA